MVLADILYKRPREQDPVLFSNRRFADDKDSLRAAPQVGFRALRGDRFRRSPSFKRVVTIAASMAAAPNHSLPKQSDDWADTKAAYSFLHHPEVTPDLIQSVHRQRTREACQPHPLVLGLQDTTELDFTHRHVVTGLGPIGDGHGQGLLQHSTLAVLPDGSLLGVLHQTIKPRLAAPENESRRERRQRAKESDFWPESVEAVGSIGSGTRLVHVMDRGGDDFGMMIACGHHGVGFLIRAQHDRYVNAGTDKLWSHLQSQPAAGYRDVPVQAREGQPARVARLTVRFAQVELDPPKGDPRFKQALTVRVVYAVEEHPPAAVAEPIDWMLLTSEAVTAFEQAGERIDWYCCRWVIEEWHKAEKTGCRLEASQLRDAESIMCLAAFIGVVAVRMLQLRDLAQSATGPQARNPDAPAHRPEALQKVVPESWRVVVAHLAKCRPEALTPQKFWLTIAKRGGFLGRKGDGQPGWQTIWRGWYDVMMMVQGVEMCNPPPDARTYG